MYKYINSVIYKDFHFDSWRDSEQLSKMNNTAPAYFNWSDAYTKGPTENMVEFKQRLKFHNIVIIDMPSPVFEQVAQTTPPVLERNLWNYTVSNDSVLNATNNITDAQSVSHDNLLVCSLIFLTIALCIYACFMVRCLIRKYGRRAATANPALSIV